MSSSGLSTMRKAKRHKPTVKPLRVLVSAASSITRAGLERLLETQPGVHLVGAIGADSLPAAIAENDPDVVLLRLEARASETNWEELIALGVPVVLLTDEADLVTATAALASGVQAVLLGDATGAELAAAAHSAAAGLLTLSGDLADLVRQAVLAHSREEADDSGVPASVADDSPEHLTLREREVLEMIMEGLSNKEIAAHLNISAHTVKFHISSILGKLGASTRTEAAAIGLRRGLITI
ncbi:MAG: response regulator transcription factor [Candidatus Korobacteraceae bacterium]